jgi:hypothetical protein
MPATNWDLTAGTSATLNEGANWLSVTLDVAVPAAVFTTT